MTQVRRLRGVNRVGSTVGRYGPNGESGVWPVHSRASDPYYDDVSLLLHMDGTDGSTTFTDSSKNAFTVTANGNVQVDDAQSKFGGAAALFDGTGDFLSVPSSDAFSFGAGDFCIESWVYRTTTSGLRMICDCRAFDALGAWSVAILTGNTLDFIHRATSPFRLTSTATVPANQWSHIAVTRAGGTVRLFIDGVDAGSTTFTGTINAGAAPAIGGGRSTGGSSVTGYYFTGSIDDFRITKGRARYTSAFNPPARPFLP